MSGIQTPPPGLESWDIVVVVLYFVIVMALCAYAMFRTNRATISGYFLAGRFMTWLPVGASIFASNIGSEHIMGLAGAGAATGLGLGAFEVGAMILLQALGWLFAPVYIASGVCTLPEFIHRRLGGQRIRMWLSVLSLLLYIFTKISVNLFAGALFVKIALGWNLYVAILLLLVLSCLCTITGGLAAVIYTDTLCTFLMTVGSLILMGLGFSEVGGYEGLKTKYMTAVSNYTLHSNSSCGWPRKDSFYMLRDPIDSDVPWPGFILGYIIVAIWYWCADQVIVQRTLSSKSLSHAQGACIFAGWIKLLPLFALLMPGMISRVLSPGLRGLMMAVMMAALMSDLTSIFNSSSTLFTIDVYAYFRSKASVRELMIVGRVMVAIVTGVSILWVPVIQNVQGAQLFLYIQSVQAYLCPPIASIYVLAVLWKRTTEKGGFWGMIIGFVVGAVRMVLDFSYPVPPCGEPDTRPVVTAKVHFMYFAVIAFVITSVAIVIISLFTQPHKDANVARLTWWNRHDATSPTDHAEAARDEELEVYSETLTSKSDEQIIPQVESPKNTGSPEERLDFKVKDPTPARRCLERLFSWLCGYDLHDGEQSITHEAARVIHERMTVITSLEQDPRAKLFLNVNLVLVSVVCVVVFVYFSV